MALPFTVHVLMGYIMSPAIVPSCGAGPSRGSVTQAVVDPFSNPVFDNPDVTGKTHTPYTCTSLSARCAA